MLKKPSASKKKLSERGINAPKGKRAKKDEQEFGKAPAGLVVCPECECTFFKKSWHHRLEGYREHLISGKPVQFKLCPADQWKKEKRYEGQLIITLTQPTPEAIEVVKNIIHNSDRQAQERDPMDRVLWIENGGGLIKVYTSENQLAQRIGKKLKSSYRGSVLEIKTGNGGEDVIRVHWEL